MPSHQERVRKYAGVGDAESHVDMTVIHRFEDDVRWLLDHIHFDYSSPDLHERVVRLRRALGDA